MSHVSEKGPRRCLSIDNVHDQLLGQPDFSFRLGRVREAVTVTCRAHKALLAIVYCSANSARNDTTMNQSDKNSKQYWYPNMGNAEIIDSLDSWGLSVTHHQLVKPTSEFVLSVYCACLQQVVDLSEESLQEPVQAALSSLDDPSTVPQLRSSSLTSADVVAGHVWTSHQH